MKGKAMTYLLLAVVVALWGYILYRIFAAVSDSDEVPRTTQRRFVAKEANLDFYRTKKTTALLLDYPDPMLKGITIETATAATPMAQTPTVDDVPAPQYVEPEPQVDVQYLGFIENLQDKKPTAIIATQGRQLMMNVGDGAAGMVLLAIENDRISIRINGKNKIIFKNEQ